MSFIIYAARMFYFYGVTIISRINVIMFIFGLINGLRSVEQPTLVEYTFCEQEHE